MESITTFCANNFFRNKTLKRFSTYAFIGILSFFCHSNLYSQKDIRFGLRIHPNFSFSSLDKTADFDKANFSLRNGLLGFNLGLVTSFQNEKWIFEISNGLNYNRTGIKFKQSFGEMQADFAAISITNELNIGYRVFSSNTPFYEVFLTSSLSHSFSAAQWLHHRGAFNQFTEFQVSFPDFTTRWQSVNVGLGMKVRTQLKNLRRLDYGLSYRFGFTKFPEMGLAITSDGMEYKAIVRPYVQTLNVDFIYYFGPRKKNKAS